MKIISGFGINPSDADRIMKDEFKQRFGISYGEWCMQHPQNAILAIDLTQKPICFTACGVLPLEKRH